VRCFHGWECDRILSLKLLGSSYNHVEDEYWMKANNEMSICVYQQGKFAEIISDKKKKPDTWNEFASMLERFANSDDSIVDVLNEYEIE